MMNILLTPWVLYPIVFLLELFLVADFFIIGQNRGLKKARFIMWAQLYCASLPREGRYIIRGFNEVINTPDIKGRTRIWPKGDISYATGYVWLRQICEAHMLAHQDGIDEKTGQRTRLFKTITPDDLAQEAQESTP